MELLKACWLFDGTFPLFLRGTRSCEKLLFSSFSLVDSILAWTSLGLCLGLAVGVFLCCFCEAEDMKQLRCVY